MSDNFRKLLVIQSDIPVLTLYLVEVCQQIEGDWLILSDQPDLLAITNNGLRAIEAKQLLGREFKHAIFDARQAFNLDAFAILVGTLVAGSTLILLLPSHLDEWKDADSLRWNEQSEAKNVPHFITHMLAIIRQINHDYPKHCKTINLKQDQPYDQLVKVIDHHSCTVNTNLLIDVSEQNNVLATLIDSQNDITFLTAKRGRGKSALAGRLAHHFNCWITAANKKALTTLMQFAPESSVFFAPDQLINQLTSTDYYPDWLIIDEAAMLPLPMIRQLLQPPYRVLLTSTVDGYEGTGQGLLLKLFTQISQNKQIGYVTLTKPFRWLSGDPLEQFIDQLTLNEPDHSTSDQPFNLINLTINQVLSNDLVSSSSMLTQFFGLLKKAHYRTSLIDLRRLLDADNLKHYVAMVEQKIIGALVIIKEGGLDHQLIEAIINGYRRPRGNLVAQSLVAHAGEPYAAQLISLRINRIAVQQSYRQRGVATLLIKQLIQDASAEHYDYISVSFAYSAELANFWKNLQFHIVHVGTHQDASSGSYAVMAIFPISKAGYELCYRMKQRLSRNWYWMKNWIDIPLWIELDHDQHLTVNDKLELRRFATTFYAYTASIAVLSRLANYIKLVANRELYESSPILLALFGNNCSEKQVVQQYGLSGRNQLVNELRKEVAQLLNKKDLFNE